MWQLYLFYVTYASYNSFGWAEGIYLKYGGQEYHKLNKNLISSQIWSAAIYEVVLNLIIGGVVWFFAPESAKSIILCMAFVSAGLDTVRYMLQSLLQCTNRIKEYARIVMTERVLFFSLAILFILTGSRDYTAFIWSEIIARIISLVYAGWVCSDVIFVKTAPLKDTWSEAKYLIGCGFKLSFASLASQLIIGIVRFAVEQKWGTVVFGKVSLALSMSNMMITCLMAVSVVLFPILRRMEEQKLRELYSVLRMLLTVPLYAILLAYIPVKYILCLWLPQYAESLKYLAILFPICIYEIRTTVLNNTYFQTYRKENTILCVNVITVGISLLFTLVTVGVMKTLDLAVVSIVFLMLIKCMLSEFMLRPKVGRVAKGQNLQELVLTVVFILSGWYMDDYKASLVYAAVYAVYLLINRKQIGTKLRQLKQLVSK